MLDAPPLPPVPLSSPAPETSLDTGWASTGWASVNATRVREHIGVLSELEVLNPDVFLHDPRLWLSLGALCVVRPATVQAMVESAAVQVVTSRGWEGGWWWWGGGVEG